MNRPLRIYVASSWRNDAQSVVVDDLRAAGHLVYDFKNPPNGTGFAWSEIDAEWKGWDVDAMVDAYAHPAAQRGFHSDMAALMLSDVVLFVWKAGVSASFETGYAAGARKRTIVYVPQGTSFEPELMWMMCDAVVSSREAYLELLAQWSKRATLVGHSDNVRDTVAQIGARRSFRDPYAQPALGEGERTYLRDLRDSIPDGQASPL